MTATQGDDHRKRSILKSKPQHIQPSIFLNWFNGGNRCHSCSYTKLASCSSRSTISTPPSFGTCRPTWHRNLGNADNAGLSSLPPSATRRFQLCVPALTHSHLVLVTNAHLITASKFSMEDGVLWGLACLCQLAKCPGPHTLLFPRANVSCKAGPMGRTRPTKSGARKRGHQEPLFFLRGFASGTDSRSTVRPIDAARYVVIVSSGHAHITLCFVNARECLHGSGVA